MLDVSGAIAVTALMWTIYQQYSLNKICEKCPFRVYAQGEEHKNESLALQKD